MNDADRKAFEDWANKEFYADLADIADTWDGNQYVDFAHHMAWCAWQKRGEWRDSQVLRTTEEDPCPACRPNTVCRTPSCGRLKGKRQEPITPSTAQINQQLLDALHRVLPLMDFEQAEKVRSAIKTLKSIQKEEKNGL